MIIKVEIDTGDEWKYTDAVKGLSDKAKEIVLELINEAKILEKIETEGAKQ